MNIVVTSWHLLATDAKLGHPSSLQAGTRSRQLTPERAWGLALGPGREWRPSCRGRAGPIGGIRGGRAAGGGQQGPAARPPRPSRWSQASLPPPTPAPGRSRHPGSGPHRLLRLHAYLEGLLLQRFKCDDDGHGGAGAMRQPQDPRITCNSRRRHLSDQLRRAPSTSGASEKRAHISYMTRL